jgi:stage V sporulation protein SpoVS
VPIEQAGLKRVDDEVPDGPRVIRVNGEDVVLVAARSNVQNVGTFIAANIEDYGNKVTLRAIGAGAVNQMAKAAVFARQRLTQRGATRGELWDLVFRPGFVSAPGEGGKEVVAMVFKCMLLKEGQ